VDIVKSYRAASPSRQLIVAAVAALAIFAVLAAVYLVVLRKPYAVLFTNLRASDAAAVVAELEKDKTPYRLADGGATIKVPADLVDKIRLDVMSSELPLKGAVGFELFNKSDMGLTEFAQKINYQRALQGELARTIMTMEAIETARVHLSIPETTIFRDDRVPPKASVTLLTRNGVALTPATILGIQRLVAASVPDLTLANVVVLDSAGAVVSSDAAGEPVGPRVKSASLQEKEAIEQYYTARLRQALNDGFAGKTIEVTVVANYDPADLPYGGVMRWAPYSRRFPLKVDVFSDDTVSQDELRAIVTAAVGGHPQDTVTFAPLAAWRPADSLQGPVVAAPVTAPTAAHSVATPAVRPTAPKPAFPWPAIAVLVIVAAGLGFYVYRRTAAPRRLSEREKQAYVNRLRLLLEEGDADVISSN
jgi:flagellar M-ring protein FliF